MAHATGLAPDAAVTSHTQSQQSQIRILFANVQLTRTIAAEAWHVQCGWHETPAIVMRDEQVMSRRQEGLLRNGQ